MLMIKQSLKHYIKTYHETAAIYYSRKFKIKQYVYF